MSQPAPDPLRRQGSFFGRIFSGLRNNFLTGIIVIAPIGLTIWLLWTLLGWVDGWVWPFVPSYYQPEAIVNRILGYERGSPDWIYVNIRGVGVAIFLLFTILVGWIAKGLIGRSLISWGEELVGRVPFVRSVYNAVKQLAETVFTQGDQKFDKMCLVEFPRQDTWSIGFIAPPPKGEVLEKLSALYPGDGIVPVYIPTTPNPTTGYIMWCRKSQVIELDMSIEDAAKLIISAGLVYPGDKQSVEAQAIAAGLKNAP